MKARLLHWSSLADVILFPAFILWFIRRLRNIIPLAFGQAVLGSLVSWAFPMAWRHRLRVGPGYYHWLG